MSNLPRLAVLLAAAASAIAQSPILVPPYHHTWSSNATRGFCFHCPVAGVITGLEVPNETSAPFQVVEVIDFGNSAPPAQPTAVIGTQLFYDNSAPANTVIPTSIPLTAGNWYGILGACTDTLGGSYSHTSYGNGAAFVSNILGHPVTLTRMDTNSGIAANGGNRPCWTSLGQLGRVEVHIDDPECFFVLGLQSTNLQFGGNTFLVEPMLVIPMTLAALPAFDIPANNNLVGLPIYGQSVMYNPTVFPNDPIRVSQGLEFIIGNRTTPYGAPNGLLMWPNGSPIVLPGGQISIGFTFQ